jgi:DNA polymerase-1
MKKFIIIDGNAIVHRAYHALPSMTTKGTMVNAVYGFTSMLLKVLKDLKPDYLAVSFDVAGGTFRHKKYKDYKATRVKADQSLYDQIPLVHQVVSAFGVPIYEKKGYEADDVIGTIVGEVRSQEPKVRSVIVTGDMDTMQLVNDDVNVYALRKGMSDIVMYDPKMVKERYGFGPEHVVDYKALRGDMSDNIPGVPGIGEKTAVELITKIGGIDEIYKKCKMQNAKCKMLVSDSVLKKLIVGEESAKMSQELATLDCNVPDLDFDLEKCDVKKFDNNKLSEILRKFEFWSLIKRVQGTGDQEKIAKIQDTNKTKNKKLEIINIDESNTKEFEKALDGANEFACKEILSGPNIFEGKLEGLVFLINDKAYYLTTDFVNTDSTDCELLRSIFSNTAKSVVGHDLKQLIKVLTTYNLQLTTSLFDTMVASYLIDSSTRAHDLRSIAQRELGVTLPDGAQGGLFGTDYKIVAQELDYIMQIKKKQEKKLEKLSDAGLFDKIEMKLIPVLAEMELNGVAIDSKALGELSKEVNKEIAKLTKKICNEAKFDFNPASSVQLREVLFDKLQLPTQGIKKGKTGYSTADAELEKLSGLHPIIDLMRDYRELAKLQNTYVDVLPTLVNKKTGRIHTTFNQAVTTTGRLSSSDPNLQNIPIRTELGKQIRDAFIAETGNVLVCADYSQIELRVVASLAQDEKMLEIFNKGEDIHIATAAAIHGVPLDKVTKEMRSSAKAVNFGVLYGMGSYGLSWRTGLTRAEAQDFIKKYFQEFAGVKKYIDQTLAFAKKEGYVETLFGRRRYIPELQSDNFMLRSAGERMAINMPIQGTAADVMKMAMIGVDKKIQDTRYKHGDVKLILQVHDELVLEVKKGLEDEVAKMVKEVMENVVKLRVPIEVSVGVGKRWGEIK